MSERPKISLKPGAAAARDPQRRPVRPGAPRPPQPADARPSPTATARPKPPPAAKRASAARTLQPVGRDGRPPDTRAQNSRPAAPRPVRTGSADAPARPLPRAEPGGPRAVPAAPAPLPHTEGIRLSKHLASSGASSRREADDWIEAGWVRVDGRMAVLGQRVLPHQHIEIDALAREQQARRITILLHKPVGYVSGQAEDGHEPAALLVTPANHWREDPAGVPFHPGHTRHLAPAGRLDIDSTGLLVLTQDGRIARHLIGEDSGVEKEYLVRVQHAGPGPLPASAMRLLQHGLELDGKVLKPAKVSWQNEEQLRFVLREGRKRQIRRMCEAVGLNVLGLKRIRIGRISLGKLPPGQWRYLGPHELF
jgi:23S rRNA pseudouridine2604 synthase